MAKTITTTAYGQIIGGVFPSRAQADKAVEAFRALPVEEYNIQVVEHLSDQELKKAYTEVLVERGFSSSQAHFYDKQVRSGKVLVAIHELTDPAPIIAIFDKYHATHNPDGSTNLRDDVLGMTTGVAVGAAVGGSLGAVVAGPIGAVAGVAAGVLLGGGTGAAVGTIVEDKK